MLEVVGIPAKPSVGVNLYPYKQTTQTRVQTAKQRLAKKSNSNEDDKLPDTEGSQDLKICRTAAWGKTARVSNWIAKGVAKHAHCF